MTYAGKPAYYQHMESKKRSGYQKAIDHFEGVAGLAEALNINRQAIYMWKGRIPKARVFEIESLTKGQLKASELER